MSDALKDFLEYSDMLPGGAMGNIPDLHCLTSMRPIGRKAGTMIGRVLQQLIYRQSQIPETPVKIGRIREASGDFARQKKEGTEFAKRKYQRKQIGI